MPIFTAIGGVVAGSLFGLAAGTSAFAIASSLVAGGLAFATKLGISYLTREKQRKYSAVQGEVQVGADTPAGTLFGTGAVKGQRVYYAKYGSGNKYNADVFVLANGWCDGLEDIYFYGEKQTLEPQPVIGNETANYACDGFGNNLSIRFYDGRPGQGIDQRLVDLTANLGKKWKATSVGAGQCYVIIEREYDDRFSKGRPDFTFVLRGLRLYDVRKDSTVAGGSGTHRLGNPATYEFSKNPGVQRMNYQLGLRGLISGRTLIGEGKTLGQLDLGSYIAAMNVCDTVRSNGKKTYESALYVTGNDDHTEILKEFDDAMAGYGVNRRGLSGVIVGAPQIPVLTITADDIPVDRAQEVAKRKSAFDLYNTISGQFTSPESQWNAESLKTVYVNADIAKDGRRRQTANDFLQVSDADIAQYLLDIRYRQNRKGGSATVPVSRRVGLAVMEGEWINFDGKTWLITEWQCDERFQITLKLAETGSDIYSDGGIEPGPIVIPPVKPINPSLLSTVQNFNVEVGLIAGANGRQKPALKFTWDPPADPSITQVRFFYRPTDDDTEEYEDDCKTPERGKYITSKDVESGKQYVARATITTVPDRFKTFTPWVTTAGETGLQYTDVLDGSITRQKIALAAIDAERLENEAVTNIKLAAESVSTAKLQVAAVTAEILANGSVISTKIADGALTTSKFASGIRPVEILAALPTTGNFAGRMVFLTTDNKLYRHTGSPAGAAGFTNATPVTDLTGQITSTQISDGAITTPKIFAGAVTADTIATNAVTADKIMAGSIIAGKIAAGAVSATEIAAFAITSSKLAIGNFTNLIPNGNLETGDFTSWRVWAGAPAVWENTGTDIPPNAPTKYVGRMVPTGAQIGIMSHETIYTAMTDGIPVKEGETYLCSIDLARMGPALTGALSLTVFGRNADGTTFNSNITRLTGGLLTGIEGEVSPTWQTFTGTLTIPAGAAKMHLYLNWQSAGTGRLNFTNLRCTRRSDGELIIDGSIVADKIATNAVTTAKISAGAVTATEIATGSITAIKLAAGSVTAAAIAASTITGDKMVANTLTTREMVMTDWTNLVVEPNFSTKALGDAWVNTGFPAGTVDITGSAATSYGTRILFFSTGATAGPQVWSSRFDVVPGNEYMLKAVVRPQSNPDGAIRLVMRFFDKAGTHIGYSGFLDFTNTTSGEVIDSSYATAPAGAASAVVAILLVTPISTVGAIWRVHYVGVTRRSNAELIVDGSITAAKIAANSITAGMIQAGAITAAKIAVGTITADRIVLNGVTTDRLALNSVTDTQTVTGSSTNTATYGSWVTVTSTVISNPNPNPVFCQVIARARAVSTAGGGSAAGTTTQWINNNTGEVIGSVGAASTAGSVADNSIDQFFLDVTPTTAGNYTYLLRRQHTTSGGTLSTCINSGTLKMIWWKR